MSKVFALEPTTKNISAAEVFGEIIYLFEVCDTRPSIWDTHSFKRALHKQLIAYNFDPTKDLLLAAGATIPLLVAMNLLSTSYPEFSVLFWHAGTQEYVCRVFTNYSPRSESMHNAPASKSALQVNP